MSTAALILAAITIWGLMSFIMVVFASMLSSRISRQEEMRSLASEWRRQHAIGVSALNASVEHKMADSI
ncbi:MAG TPA: hypothetical protein ENJ02_11030 [Chloroflexi bacterium]|nr:hypothetical protein [Chloroflexota bacterium]